MGSESMIRHCDAWLVEQDGDGWVSKDHRVIKVRVTDDGTRTILFEPGDEFFQRDAYYAIKEIGLDRIRGLYQGMGVISYGPGAKEGRLQIKFVKSEIVLPIAD